MKIKVEGANGVSAEVLCDSISNGVRLLTFEITFWRGVLAEINTHRMLSKNSASSRAIPFGKMVEQLNGRPHRFGSASKGMQDAGELAAPVKFKGGRVEYSPEDFWLSASWAAADAAEAYYKAGYHKQVYNRLLEPFQTMKTVISGTEWDNFFWLRDDDAADPSIRELARCMREAMDRSTPTVLEEGEWHLPYVATSFSIRDKHGKREQKYIMTDANGDLTDYISLEDAITVSCARCAAVSFRNVDYGLEKSKEVYARLVGSAKKHASALEHCATPIAPRKRLFSTVLSLLKLSKPKWQEGVTHMGRDGNLWSGPFRGWVQHRKLVPGENYTKGM